MVMTNNKLVRGLLIAYAVILILTLITPNKTAYKTVESNYLTNVKYDAELLKNKKLASTENGKLLSYGVGVCDVLNAKKGSGNIAINYLAKKAFRKENTNKQNLDIIKVVIPNAVRHLCPDYISLLGK